MAEAPAPGVQFPQPSVNPPQVPQVLQAPQAPQAMNPPARAAGQIAPAPQLVQVNVANAQDELEINFGISVPLSILDFLVVSLFWSHYGSGYHLCCVPASVLHGRITFVSSPVSMALLHIKGGVSFPRDKIVSCTRGGFRSIFIVGGTFVSFCFVTLVGVLAAILHIFVMVSFPRRYAPATDLLVVLCCFVLRRVRLTLKAVGSYGGGLRRVYFTIWNMCIHCAYSQE